VLKVAIVGCGKIADAHASQIARIDGCEIVAACDREPLMARQFCVRFGVKGQFADLDRLLTESHVDVVHLTTPPATHFELAMQCLDSGCHVYVEKPFTLRGFEARELVAAAKRKGLKITVGHDEQFGHASRRLRGIVQAGYLGGQPVHMESVYCYDFKESRYARAVLANRQHWVRRLPGGLLQNIISHGISRIAEFLTTESPEITACGFVSPVVRNLSEQDIVDELRVIITEPGPTTAYFTFSSQMRPVLHQFRIYGPANGILLDQDHETVIRLRGPRFKSYANQFIPPLIFARQHVGNVLANAARFLRRDQMKSDEILISLLSIDRQGLAPAHPVRRDPSYRDDYGHDLRSACGEGFRARGDGRVSRSAGGNSPAQAVRVSSAVGPAVTTFLTQAAPAARHARHVHRLIVG
jgi:predicted dehydrogenase